MPKAIHIAPVHSHKSNGNLIAGAQNLTFVGQFCELPEDVVFKVEYSIRSAQTAVYSLLGLSLAPPPVYKGRYDPRVLLKAFLTLHDIRAHA